ncbi:putative cytosolic Cu/Zn superoxide dismutase [Aspergillus puulaauensis]|uniref:superoxide dismutase n=1 Tax=Aspergillus puulaauensis TaxID=1220207 RepID=A0A7R7XQL3_9EURO|nr:uncharacterized protein APUU_50622A [Aspergillus puulaauensis]BCS25911.1 hypothetical protein APUU_50622A [Aspergillus puulaauensis]
MNLKFLPAAVLGLLVSTTAAQDNNADTTTDTDTNAPVITDNEPLSFHHASLLKKENTTVYGAITITTRRESAAVQVDVSIGGIPEGEYLNYHIHASRVPDDGNCYLTGAHLDPHGRGQEPPCTITAPQTCEVGDLSGKHGPAWAPAGEEFRATYSDFFLANTPGDEAYYGDLSWVVHGSNGDRLTCGNFDGFSGGGFGNWGAQKSKA